MSKAISNTSPLLFLYRIGVIDWLPKIFDVIWTTSATVYELQEGKQKGYDVVIPSDYDWLKIVNPNSYYSEWLALDLGAGELGAISLALENPDFIILLDDSLARRTAQAAGLPVWGTLRIILEAKKHGLTKKVEPHLKRLVKAGLWISDDIFQRVLKLANEN